MKVILFEDFNYQCVDIFAQSILLTVFTIQNAKQLYISRTFDLIVRRSQVRIYLFIFIELSCVSSHLIIIRNI